MGSEVLGRNRRRPLFATVSLTFSQSFFEKDVSYSENYYDFSTFEIKPEMRDVLAKMRVCGK